MSLLKGCNAQLCMYVCMYVYTVYKQQCSRNRILEKAKIPNVPLFNTIKGQDKPENE